jgi:hypothetical protein
MFVSYRNHEAVVFSERNFVPSEILVLDYYNVYIDLLDVIENDDFKGFAVERKGFRANGKINGLFFDGKFAVVSAPEQIEVSVLNLFVETCKLKNINVVITPVQVNHRRYFVISLSDQKTQLDLAREHN